MPMSRKQTYQVVVIMRELSPDLKLMLLSTWVIVDWAKDLPWATDQQLLQQLSHSQALVVDNLYKHLFQTLLQGLQVPYMICPVYLLR